MINIDSIANIPFRFVASQASKGHIRWLNDKTAVKLIYRGQMGVSLNLDNPQTFNEKLQWLKIHDRNPLYTKLVDKSEVKKYVKSWIGEEYLIPELALWEKAEDVMFDDLPIRFVLKCTHDSGSAIVCRDKDSLDISEVKKHLSFRMQRSHYWSGLEWPYKDVKPRIIAEQYMEDSEEMGLTDYKFYCFNGEPKFLYISRGLEKHETAYISFFDLKGNMLPFGRADYQSFPSKPPIPSKFDEMIHISKKCAERIGSPFIRVDLYQINSRVYFSEFTFTPCGGYMRFIPEEYDRIVGEMLVLPRSKI